jgi:hypothetical protein
MARIDLSGRQIPTLSKLNIDGEFTLDAASGTSGQLLASAGAGNTPTWTTPIYASSQTANTFLAAPAGSAGTPTFRAISYNDIYPGTPPTVYGQVIQYAPVGNGMAWSSAAPVYPSSSPVFTSAVTLAAGTTSLTPLKLTAGTNLTTPVYGAVEASTDAIYLTDNPGGTTGAGRGILLAQQMVFLQSNSGTNNTTTAANIFPTANDVLTALEPAKLYRFRAKYFSTINYGGTYVGLNILFAFSAAPTATKYTFRTYTQTTSSGTTSQGVITTNAASTIVPLPSAVASWVTEIDGYFTTHATTVSTLTPQFACTASAGGSTLQITTGSWFEIEKLGASTVANVAGSWA